MILDRELPAVLLTGASGSLGSAVAERLTSLGCRVIRVTRKRSEGLSNSTFKSFFYPVQIDLDQISDHAEELKYKLGDNNNTQLILLNCGWGGVERLTDGCLADQLENVATLSILIRKCSKIGVKRIVHIGSFEEDLLAQYISKESTTQLKFESGQINYAIAKTVGRDIGLLESYLAKADFIQVRFSQVVDHRDRYDNYVNNCVRNIRRNIPIEPPTNNGLVDIIHHDDLIEGIICSMFNWKPRSNHYLGVAHPITLKEFFADLQSGSAKLYRSSFEGEAIRLGQLRANLLADIGMQYKYEYKDIILRLLDHAE
jgi:nucleoside-diphosphate-sugar epimerase